MTRTGISSTPLGFDSIFDLFTFHNFKDELFRFGVCPWFENRFSEAYLHSFAGNLILSTVVWPTEEKKLLNLFAIS